MSRFAALALACLIATPALADWDRARLDSGIKTIERDARGRLGVALIDLKDRKSWSHRGQERFPMQSVFKLPLAVAVLQAVEAGKLRLDQEIRVKRNELALYWSPLKKGFKGEEQGYTVTDLLTRSAGASDNSAADVLMKRIGGPKVVTTMLNEGGIAGISVDRYEREFQPEIAGLPAFAWDKVIDDEAFEAAIAAMPKEKRRAALESYIKGEARDSATPEASIAFLEGLARGNWLREPAHDRLLTDILLKSPTGAQRVRAGLPTGATFAHKTGTGDTLDGINSATNDIGIVALPDGRRFAIAIYLAGAQVDAAAREAAHAAVAKLAVESLN